MCAARRELPRTVEHLTELIGRVSLKDLVREATDVIERLCIEAALELTGDNRASAAEMLGLQPAEPVREAAPLRPGRSGGRREGRGLDLRSRQTCQGVWTLVRVQSRRVHACRTACTPRRAWSCSSRSPGSRRCGRSAAACCRPALHVAGYRLLADGPRRRAAVPGRWSAAPARRSTTGSTATSMRSTNRTARSPRAAFPAAGGCTSR